MKLTIILAGMGVVGCSATEQPIPLTQYLIQCDSFRGKTVQVSGYMDECAGYACHLITGKPGTNRFVSVKGRSEIGVGGDNPDFEFKAGPLQNSYVVITGRIDEHSCDGAGGTDRSAGIYPTHIRAWTESEGAPASTH